jgi:hypothetical protein
MTQQASTFVAVLSKIIQDWLQVPIPTPTWIAALRTLINGMKRFISVVLNLAQIITKLRLSQFQHFKTTDNDDEIGSDDSSPTRTAPSTPKVTFST